MLSGGRQCWIDKMADVTIYHNPRCTKSRQTLALLRQNNIEPTIIEYLKDPPDATELATISKKLGLAPVAMIRKKEAAELNLSATADPLQWIRRMVRYPKIMQRPIVVCGERARIGRPPENVLELFP